MTTLSTQTGLKLQEIHQAIPYLKENNSKGYTPLNISIIKTSSYDIKKTAKITLFLIGELALVYLAFKFGHSRGWDTGFDTGWVKGKNFGKTEAAQECGFELIKQYANSLVTLIRTVEGIIHDATHQ